MSMATGPRVDRLAAIRSERSSRSRKVRSLMHGAWPKRSAAVRTISASITGVDTVHVTTRKAWRSWLARNHAKKNEIWLVYWRAHTGKPRVSYNDAVEEALCYGW